MFESQESDTLVPVIDWFDCVISFDTSSGISDAVDAPRRRHQPEDSRHVVYSAVGDRVTFICLLRGVGPVRMKPSMTQSSNIALSKLQPGLPTVVKPPPQPTQLNYQPTPPHHL